VTSAQPAVTSSCRSRSDCETTLCSSFRAFSCLLPCSFEPSSNLSAGFCVIHYSKSLQWHPETSINQGFRRQPQNMAAPSSSALRGNPSPPIEYGKSSSGHSNLILRKQLMGTSWHSGEDALSCSSISSMANSLNSYPLDQSFASVLLMAFRLGWSKTTIF
jgi:hypothetical protein